MALGGKQWPLSLHYGFVQRRVGLVVTVSNYASLFLNVPGVHMMGRLRHQAA